jgi:hypothetical protein
LRFVVTVSTPDQRVDRLLKAGSSWFNIFTGTWPGCNASVLALLFQPGL